MLNNFYKLESFLFSEFNVISTWIIIKETLTRRRRCVSFAMFLQTIFILAMLSSGIIYLGVEPTNMLDLKAVLWLEKYLLVSFCYF